MVLEVAGKKVIRVSGDKTHPANFGRLCTKGSTSAQALRDSGRMESAFMRNKRNSDPGQVPMDAAIRETARRLRHILDNHGPDALSFYVSGQMSLEAQYLANKLAKGFIGTNNIESNSRLCMASAGSGYKLSLGADGPPGSYEDMDHADLFFVIGANMADCHPILFLRMMDRVKAGARLIVVDPRRNTTADKADLFMQIKPGTDLALLNGLLHLLVKNEHTDQAFIAEFTDGWESMPAFLEDYTPGHVSEITGLAEADIRQAADWIGAAPEWMSCWTMGLNQSTHGTWNTNAICNLHLATGKICRPGSGPFSLTGQPNAMGGREMGYMGPGLPGQRSVLVDADRAFIEDMWKVPHGTLKTAVGQGTVDMFSQMAQGKIKACWIICTNPVATVPNRKTVIAGLEAAELVITQDAFLDTETNRYADILLPGALWAEAEGVMINSERNLTLMQQAIDPPGQALPDWQIIASVACEMGYADTFSYGSAAEVFDEIKLAWNDKTGYDLRGASYQRLRETPLQWPCPPASTEPRHPVRYLNDGISQKLKQHADGSRPRLVFPTEHGKAVFFARPHMPPAEMPDDDYPFILNTGRLQHQWHTMTKTGKIPTLNKLNPGPFVEVNPEDAALLDIRDKDQVEVCSRRGRAVLPAVVTDRVRPGNCFVPFHWNDVFGDDLAINAVTNDAVDPISFQPEFKCCAVAMTRVAAPSDKYTVTDADNEVRAVASAGAATVSINEEHELIKIDALAKLLGIETIPAVDLGHEEQSYLSGYITGLRSSELRKAGEVPTLPTSAPMEPAKRLWIDGLLAGLFARTYVSEAESFPLLPDSEKNTAQGESAHTPILVLWASQTGNAEEFSKRCGDVLTSAGYNIQIECMDNYPVNELPKVRHLLLLSSTFGDGDPPDNGARFWSALNADDAPGLMQTKFSILAFGDSSYDQFCGHGKKLDSRLEALGAQRMIARVDCEPDYQEQGETWLKAVVACLAAAIVSQPQMELVTITEDHHDFIEEAKDNIKPKYSKSNPMQAQLACNVLLSQPGASKETRQFVFTLPDKDFTYEAGDALGIWPSNCPHLVSELISVAGLTPDMPVHVDGYGEIALQVALLKHFEIARVTPDFMKFVFEASKHKELARLLKDESKAKLKEWLWGRKIVDVLYNFPIKVEASVLLAALKRLQPRLYSISSSPKATPEEVHITVSTVRYACEGRLRKGVCSTYLADFSGGMTIPIFVQKSANFRPPAQADTPMIMVGPGTGIAPFRAFLQERRARGHNGPNWLFFGEQHAATDFYYRDEIESWHKDGFLTRIDLAFSRDQPNKIYVQDRMRERGADLWEWLQMGAHFYVCGDASRMAKDVDEALREVVQTHGRMSTESAKAYVQNLAAEKRYVRDVY
ncbi:ferredoxin-nitrate reductase [Methylophilaceae bacterium]|nr:ferredoxin-nitrate reductase [Methylophilaceae bacterium]